MTRGQALRISRDPTADPFDRYDAHKLLSKPTPKREQRLDTAGSGQDWACWVDARIEEKLASQQQFLLDVVGEALGQSLAAERRDARVELEDTVRSLRMELTQTQAVISELRTLLAVDRGVVDLPNPLRARAN